MAFYSLHAYDADAYIPGFLGLKQQDILMNPDTRFAAEAENVETPNGVLQPRAANRVLGGSFEGQRIETLAQFHRRWFTGTGSKDWLIAAVGGKLYYRQSGVDMWSTAIPMPTGIDSFQSNVWSWVTYEINPDDGDTVDVLLISNQLDGMFMVIPPDMQNPWSNVKTHDWDYQKAMTWEEVVSPAWAIQPVDTRVDPDDEDEDPPKFGVIERYAERIWGGNIAGFPDKLIYSRPYDPTDWRPDADVPEDGGGEINQPSWDGDSFTALKAFGDQLLAFKRNRIWRILGTNPGEYEFREQFGSGTPYAKTIAKDGERLYMMERDGLAIYDGQNTAPYQRENIEKFWRTVNRNAMDQMCCAMFRNKYYLALPVNGSAVNNAMLIYDLREGTILLHTGIYVEDFLPTEDMLYATTSDLPGRLTEVRYDSWVTGAACGKAAKWTSPWMDFGRKDMQKGGFDLYIVPEVQSQPVTLTISVQTEKKTKTKEYTISPVVGTGKEHRGKKLHFGGTGRKFRVIIQAPEGNTAPWRLIGGIHMIVETDPD